MGITIISKRIEEAPEYFSYRKADFMGEYPGIPEMDYDPFPEKKPDEVVCTEVIARKLVLHAKLKGDVMDVRPGVSITVDGYNLAVHSAKIAINTKNEGESTSEIVAEHFFTPPEPLKFLAKLRSKEEIYRDDHSHAGQITDAWLEIKRYFARHPEKLHNLAPRKFEELIAEILKDLGFDTELTSATRDGGRDIYAYLRNQVTSFLMFVECKKWSAEERVGIEIVQRLYGVAKVGGAHKSMIVTTSFFTLPAQQEHKKIAAEMELKDYENLKDWLSCYK